MEAALERASPLIGSAELDSRRAIREEIEVLLNKWIDSLLPSEEQTSITRPRGKVMTIGTGTLELLTPESDIDLVCLLPALPGQSHRAVDENGEVRSPLRNRWIEEFGALLQQNEHVEDYSKIDTAANPTLCCKYRGVDLDILLSILPRKTTIEPEFLEVNATHDNWQTFQDDTVLAELDDASQRSLNGVRVARLLLSDRSLVPDVAVFKLVLRFVKAWAKARGVYNNISGYFGGITWALCVAKVFMKHREERSAEELVCQFFKYFTEIDYDKETVELRTPIAPNTDEATKKLIAMESAWGNPLFSSDEFVSQCE
ncbi:unnamed protein product [Amoebophrya sp. A25]|nr:unnamed protein product [Amoebophrya sp. A25]|eukprot:GSA25T00015534001.1